MTLLPLKAIGSCDLYWTGWLGDQHQQISSSRRSIDVALAATRHSCLRRSWCVDLLGRDQLGHLVDPVLILGMPLRARIHNIVVLFAVLDDVSLRPIPAATAANRSNRVHDGLFLYQLALRHLDQPLRASSSGRGLTCGT